MASGAVGQSARIRATHCIECELSQTQSLRMADLLKHVAEVESALETLAGNSIERDKARRRIRNAVQGIASIPPDARLTLAETIRRAVASCPSNDKRTLAVVLVRMVGVTDLLTDVDMQKCRKEIVGVVEDTCPDLTKNLFGHDEMNHEKIEAIAAIHQRACGSLEPLVQPFVSLPDLAERRQNIMRSINGSRHKGYLGTFGFNPVLLLVRSLLSQVDKVVEARGHELQTTVQQLLEDIPIQKENCGKIGTFVSAEFAMPFLERPPCSGARGAGSDGCRLRLRYQGARGRVGGARKGIPFIVWAR